MAIDLHDRLKQLENDRMQIIYDIDQAVQNKLRIEGAIAILRELIAQSNTLGESAPE